MKYDFETAVPCHYTTYKDIYDRLHGTICKYEGKPVYVAVEDEDIINLYNLRKNTHLKSLSITEGAEELDIESLELGYMNYISTVPGKANVYYIARSVKRQWKQGITNGNCYGESIEGKPAATGDLFVNTGFEKSLLGEFPSFNEAKEIMGKNGECAISQHVALKTLPVGVTLVYLRQKNIGWIAPGSKDIKLEGSKLDWVSKRELILHDLHAV